jgi:competence protein ComEC
MAGRFVHAAFNVVRHTFKAGGSGEMEQRKNSKKALKITLLVFLAVGLFVSFLPFGAEASWRHIFRFFGLTDFAAAADNAPLSVHVLDVGKADSIFVACEGKYMLIDGGTQDCGEGIAEYLDRRGVKKLDYVFNTHPDADHIGGLGYLIRHFQVGSYYAPDIPQSLIPQGEEYAAVQTALRQTNTAWRSPSCGESMQLGNLKIKVLAPVKTGDSTNNNSIVLMLTFGKNRFLLMGDAEKEEERDLLEKGENLSANVLKIGHHGSSTSTSEPFLRAVQPNFAAISVARDSSRLPKRDVLKRLWDANIPVYRTDVSGTLVFMSDGEKITVLTEK